MFQRQWFNEKSQVGLSKPATTFELELQNNNYSRARKIIKQNITLFPEYWSRQAIRLKHIIGKSELRKTSSIKYAVNNFWPDMDPRCCQLIDLFKSAAPEISFEYIEEDYVADICFTSCYGYDPLISIQKQPQAFQVLFLGENVRPSFSAFDLAISFDMDSHSGRNIFLPLWMFEINMFGRTTYKDRVTYDINNFTKQRC